jgi:alkanesulfonate monooxygenase SsuD/methylene tetrahydromethanopterin reductase-like flavin-dependent oxidoreductase (luciferase family)
MPKPVQQDGVPVWISGTVNPAVARRIARFGSGWIPWGSAIADPADSIAAMKGAIADAGGDPSRLQVQGAARAVKKVDGTIDYAATMAVVPALVDAGVTDIRISAAVPAGYERAVDFLTPLAEAFQDATR